MDKRERFIEKAHAVHGDKYDYSKVEYYNCKEKVCIICPEHGEFWQTPDNHLQGKGCPICRYISSSKKNSKNINDFIKKAEDVHNKKYDYSKVEYKNNSTKVCIICPEHGEFWQTPTGHIDKKQGCPKCSKNHKYTTKEYLESIPKDMLEKYDYSKFVYNTTHTKSIVICPKHGEFWQTPHNLRKGIGCPKCKESKTEKEVRRFLNKNKIVYKYEYKFSDVNKKQSLDFFLPEYNIAIECQGVQHFKPTDFAGKGQEWAENEYKHIIELDNSKKNECNQKGITLFYYTKEKIYENCEYGRFLNKIEDLLNYL